jgi:hypothetical protein
MSVADLPATWRTRAAELERFAPAAAEAFKAAADELEVALRAAADEELTLEQAAQASGYSTRRLRELLADGTIENAGRKGAPRVRRGDLPRRAKQTAATDYSPAADAARLLARSR